jgi:hypothetical protein
MSDFTFNVALGREVEYYQRVDGNDPANSALIGVVIRAAAIEADTTLKDYDTLGAILAAANDEATNSGYARKTWTDADLVAYTVDDANDRIQLFLPTPITFATIGSGDIWAKLLVCYDSDTTSGTDTNIIPVTAHDLLYQGSYVVPNGSNITITNTNGFTICS